MPISRQIADQIAALCVSGGLRPGERLPSVRELARELAVNQNTVLRVYERLCGEGLLEMRHGQGTFVAAGESPGRLAMHRADCSMSCGRSLAKPLAWAFRPTSCTACWLKRPAASTALKPSRQKGKPSHERTGD